MIIFNNGINNIEIEVYDLDSIDSIINRLCAKFNTLSKFIYFPNGLPTMEIISENSNEPILFENMLRVIKKTNNFEELYKILNEKLNFTLNDVVYYYLILNEEIDRLEDMEKNDPMMRGNAVDPFLLFLNNSIKNIDKDANIDIKNIITNRYGSVINIRKQIENNILYVKKQSEIFKDFNNRVGLNYTEFELEKVKFEIILDVENISLLEIFNNIKLNKNIPFATTHYFYKILKDFTPFIEWTDLFNRSKTYFDKYKNINRDKNIIFKILQKEDFTDMKDYSECILNYENNITKIKLEHNIKNFLINSDDLIERILTILNIDKIKSKRDIGVNGVYYYPIFEFNKYILLDIIMNDNLFSSIITVDESSIGIKDNIFIYFNNAKVGNLTAYLTIQTVFKNIPTDDEKDKEFFPKNSKYVRVKISKCDNIEKVKYFQNILSKLFVLYNEKYQNVIDFYAENYINFVREEEIYEENNDNLLKNIDRNIFRPNYTRKCPHPPTYITDEEAEIVKKEGKQIIEFPKEVTNNSKPRKYICTDEEYQYPGLRFNPFDNANIFPYIPCCYSKDQMNTKGSKYRNYYFDEPLLKKKNIQQGIYVSNIIIPNNKFGTLPENLNKIFFNVDNSGTYYRKGVFRNTNSFLNCVMEALDDETNILNITDEGPRDSYLKKIRNSLATNDYAACCKQEMYDYKIENIVEKIKNNDEYFDPKLFIHLLEIKYNCNIFIFTRNNKGELILPRCIKGYYKLKNKNKCIFIYEHTGGESERIKYPQCELIVRQVSDTEEIEYNFLYENIISQNIFNVFNKINTSYIFNTKIEFIDFNLFLNNNIIPINQIIDTYGKTRMFNIIYNYNGNNINVSLLTSPIQPYNLPLLNNITEIYKIDINDAFSFAKEAKIIILKQIIDENDLIKELHGKIGNINVNIPINGKNRVFKSIPSSKFIGNVGREVNSVIDTLSYPENDISTLENYNKYKKVSRYITEYIYWLYSKFIFEEKINVNEILNTDNFINFKNKYIIIQNDFEYKKIFKTFSMDSNLMKDNKLVIKSEETLKRLFYVLKLYIIRNYKKIIDYHTKVMIENFYIDITDFDEYSFQVILEGESSIYKWINEKKKNNLLFKIIIPLIETPYFFKNNLISNKIYIAQNVDTLLKAINISLIWNKYKYNPGINVYEDQKDILEFTLYSYTNNNNIKKYIIEGIPNDYKIKILGYKIENKSYYTVLLN